MAYGGRGYRGDYGGGGYRGDGFLSKLGKGLVRAAGTVVGGIARTALGGGIAGTVAGGITRGFAPAAPAGTMPGGGVRREPGITGMVHRMAPGGSSGYTRNGKPVRIRKDGKPYKRPAMNVLNPRAATRAIRRIKGARHVLQAIEREMPHRKAVAQVKRCGCK